MTWQPISTAPKDGSQVILWWQDTERGGKPRAIQGEWYCAKDGDEFWWSSPSMPIGFVATHWMPIPPPPEPTP
jgi:hypothetical protein